MISVAAGASFEAELDDVPGLVGSLGVEILDTPAGTVVLARTTAGIVEAPVGSGLYAVTLTAPSTPGQYSIVWDDGAGHYGRESLIVGAAGATAPVPIVALPTPGAGRTFAQLQDEALSDDFDPSKYRERVQRWLNEAEAKVFRKVRVPEGEWTESITTAAGVNETTLDASVIRTNSLRNTDDREPLEEVSSDWIDDAPESKGKPSFFALVGNKLLLYPTPDGAYELELRYQSRSSSMSEDDDRPLLNADYQDLLVTYARARLYRAEDDREMAAEYMAEFRAGVLELKADVGRRSRGRRRQIPGMYAGQAAPTFRRPS